MRICELICVHCKFIYINVAGSVCLHVCLPCARDLSRYAGCATALCLGPWGRFCLTAILVFFLILCLEQIDAS